MLFSHKLKNQRSLATYKHLIFVFSGILFISCLLMGRYIAQNQAQRADALIHEEMLNIGMSISQNIQRNLSEAAYATEILAIKLETDHYQVKHFSELGHIIISKKNAVNGVFLAKDGILSHAYPQKGYEKIIGHNLLTDPLRSNSVLNTIKNKELMFFGPKRLLQNKKLAIVARNPVFNQQTGAFWGFAIAVIKIEDLITYSGLSSANTNQHLYFRLGQQQADHMHVFFQTPHFKDIEEQNSHQISLEINVHNNIWTLSILHPQSHTNILLITLSYLTLSLLVAVLFYLYKVNKYKNYLHVHELNKTLYFLSSRDELTKILNRRAGLEILDAQLAYARRYKHNTCILFMDIDFFKQVNDTYGHQVGDDFIIHVVKLLQQTLRSSDVIIRMGGDEFLIILPNTTFNNLPEVAIKLLTKAQKTPLLVEKTNATIAVSLSIGGAQWDGIESKTDLISRADKRLYAAKAAGRNTYTI